MSGITGEKNAKLLTSAARAPVANNVVLGKGKSSILRRNQHPQKQPSAYDNSTSITKLSTGNGRGKHFIYFKFWETFMTGLEMAVRQTRPIIILGDQKIRCNVRCGRLTLFTIVGQML